jgi:hypothetical protein
LRRRTLEICSPESFSSYDGSAEAGRLERAFSDAQTIAHCWRACCRLGPEEEEVLTASSCAAAISARSSVPQSSRNFSGGSCNCSDNPASTRKQEGDDDPVGRGRGLPKESKPEPPPQHSSEQGRDDDSSNQGHDGLASQHQQHGLPGCQVLCHTKCTLPCERPCVKSPSIT